MILMFTNSKFLSLLLSFPFYLDILQSLFKMSMLTNYIHFPSSENVYMPQELLKELIPCLRNMVHSRFHLNIHLSGPTHNCLYLSYT